MIIERTSPVTGAKNRMDLPVTAEQLQAWQSGTLIQQAMPHLSPDEREFLMTGIHGDDWARLWAAGE